MTARFCDCRFPNCIELNAQRSRLPDLVRCRCGENGVDNVDPWQWNSTDGSDALITGKDIVFHPTSSRGTAIVRGNRSLEPGMVHFWEMLAISPLVGTDVMFGIGTQSVNLGQHEIEFVSALGTDDQSWGFSYYGKIQHGAEQWSYSKKFSQGCLIGVYLDRSRGHLEFYLNRKRLGVAFTNIPVDPNVNIYPMVCSTAVRTVIRLTNSTSMPDTLLLRSVQTLSTKQPDQLLKFRQIPAFKRIFKSFWFLYM
ncbi:SPRY domain-containing SOCS box protein 3-like [Drosophila rhopaloa]|uniref:SPRY domain-containing SOCS box protein 3-like n=1 Tax=Drosophila rhopaloa TaxID=1041015 RepID=A0A6P4EQI1_DRORH|nr:SPRY domain-containing SOCS box protein 3-like [Drosophila rhopaloa]